MGAMSAKHAAIAFIALAGGPPLAVTEKKRSVADWFTVNFNF